MIGSTRGTKGALTQESVSTMAGLPKTKTAVVSLPNNGGDLTWEVLTINTDDTHNMSTVYGLADETNVDTYAIIVIDSPTARKTTMHPAHDDYGHIWINGTKVYDNPNWTGGRHTVTQPTEVDLNKGLNVLLYRTGESGGDDHFNLHFTENDADLKLYPDANDRFFEVISAPGTAVEPGGKLSTTWGDIKRR